MQQIQQMQQEKKYTYMLHIYIESDKNVFRTWRNLASWSSWLPTWAAWELFCSTMVLRAAAFATCITRPAASAPIIFYHNATQWNTMQRSVATHSDCLTLTISDRLTFSTHRNRMATGWQSLSKWHRQIFQSPPWQELGKASHVESRWCKRGSPSLLCGINDISKNTRGIYIWHNICIYK